MSLPGDVFEVRHIYQYEGQELQNVYFYKYALLIDPLGDPISLVLAERFRDTVQPSIVALQPTSVLFSRISVRNLLDEDDKYDLFQSVPGTYTVGDALPKHDTAAFSLKGQNGSTRDGSKRIGVIGESVSTNGIITAPAYLVLATVLRAVLAAPVTTFFIFTQNTFTPCIVKRIREGAAPNYTYRLPLTLAETVLNTIVSVGFSIVVGTQDTRKR